MSSPLCTILIPTFNRGNFLQDSVRSAQNQIERNLEIIVIDNCSTDDSVNILERSTRDDNRVKIIRSQENSGPTINWFRGLRAVRTPFTKILFSDDFISPYFIRRLIEPLKDNSIGFSFCPALIGKDISCGRAHYQFSTMSQKIKSEDFIDTALYLPWSLPVSPGAALFRTKDLLENLLLEIPGFDFRATGAGADLLLFLLTAKSYPQVYFSHFTDVFFRVHDGSITISDKSGAVDAAYKAARNWFSLRHYRRRSYES
jgi:glycosyltransferase involved in cell wall biosynthesis